jgi:hypothetical protein
VRKQASCERRSRSPSAQSAIFQQGITPAAKLPLIASRATPTAPRAGGFPKAPAPIGWELVPLLPHIVSVHAKPHGPRQQPLCGAGYAHFVVVRLVLTNRISLQHCWALGASPPRRAWRRPRYPQENLVRACASSPEISRGGHEIRPILADHTN